MARYGITIYRTDVYGPDPGLALSVEPIELTVLDFNCVKVVWRQANGTYTRARLLRSQTSYPETADDGEIVWFQESEGTDIQLNKDTLLDGRENASTNVAIVPGKPIFYRMFLYEPNTNRWVNAGENYTLVPANHNLHYLMMNWLPRVYTSDDYNPIGVLDTSSDLYKFLEAFSFTGEEWLTFIDLLQPTVLQDKYAHVPRIDLERKSLGLISESTLPVKNQRTLVREARKLYAKKGTKLGVAAYVEALTGFAPLVVTEPNLLLSNQDATFYETTGNWEITNGTLDTVNSPTHKNDLIFNAAVRAIDKANYCEAVVSSTPSAMTLGYDGDPVTAKIPVTPGKKYSFSCYIKTPSGESITPTVKLYDQYNNVIATYADEATVSTTWSQITVENIYAPKNVSQSVVYAESDGTKITYTVSGTTQIPVGSIISVIGFDNNDFNVEDTVVSETTETTFSVLSTTAESFEASPSTIVNTQFNGQDAVYAGISLAFSAAGTYYIDMVCLQEGTSTAYSEARAIDITLSPAKINYIKNPTFGTDEAFDGTTNWTLTGTGATITADTSVPVNVNAGSYAAKIQSSNAWTLTSNTVPIVTGQYWTGSVYLKSTVNVTMSLIRRDSGGSILHTESYEIPANTKYSRYYVTDVVDCNCSSSTIEVEFSGTGGVTYLDAVQLEKSFKMTEYFDGTFAFNTGASWAGTAKNSYSVYYPAKELKITRLTATMEDWIPKYLWWRLSSESGLEVTSLVQ